MLMVNQLTGFGNVNKYTPSLGELYEGGYYIGDIDVSSVTYLILFAPKSTEGGGQWKTTNSSTAGTSSLVDGLTNSTNMNDANHPAAQYCMALSSGGYTDWYLPAKDELNLAWTNLSSLPVDQRPTTSVDHPSAQLFSSTESSSTTAWAQRFTTGAQVQATKNFGYLFRAVRRVAK